MQEVRLLIAALGVGALGVGTLAACGDDPVGSQLAPVAASGDGIVVTSDSNLARQLAGESEAPPAIALTLADGVTVPATTATIAWTAEAGEPTAEDVQALAVALGADGEVERDDAGAWSVGTSVDNIVGLLAAGYLGDSFIYTSAARWEQFVANPCDPSSTCPGPMGAPNEATALTAAQRVLDALEFEREAVDVTTDERNDGMGVTVRSLIDGLPTQGEPDVELLIGSDGSILQAGGRTSVTDQTRTVDLIDGETAVARAERSISAGPFLTRPPIAELPATTSLVPMPTVTTPPPSLPGNSGAPVAPQLTVDTVTRFGVGHELVWDVDGRRWSDSTSSSASTSCRTSASRVSSRCATSRRSTTGHAGVRSHTSCFTAGRSTSSASAGTCRRRTGCRKASPRGWARSTSAGRPTWRAGGRSTWPAAAVGCAGWAGRRPW